MATGAMVAGTLYSANEQRKAGKDAKRAGRANAAAQLAETKEAARRLSGQQANDRAYTRTAVAASGLELSGSNSLYLQAMEAEQQKELAWLNKAGATSANLLEQQGKDAQRIANAGAVSTLATGLGSAATMYDQFGWMGFGGGGGGGKSTKPSISMKTFNRASALTPTFNANTGIA